jgi:hypothetical protein
MFQRPSTMRDQVSSHYPTRQSSRRSDKKTKNNNNKSITHLLDGTINKRNEYKNKSKEILSLKLTSSEDLTELQMERIQKQHHHHHQHRHHHQRRHNQIQIQKRSSSSNSSIIVEQRPESIHNHLCSSKVEKLNLMKERKPLRKERNKRKRKRFLHELKSSIMR